MEFKNVFSILGMAVLVLNSLPSVAQARLVIDKCRQYRESPAAKCPHPSIQKVIEQDEIESVRKAISKFAVPEYYIKFRINQFLVEVLQISPENTGDVIQSLESKTIVFPISSKDELVGLTGDPIKSEAYLNFAISRLLGAVARDVPEVSELADAFIVKLQVAGHFSSSGVQVGQVEDVVIESQSNKPQDLKTSLRFSSCSTNGRLIEIGDPGGCGFDSKVTGNFENPITDEFSIGGSFASTQSQNKNIPEGNLFFKIRF